MRFTYKLNGKGIRDDPRIVKSSENVTPFCVSRCPRRGIPLPMVSEFQGYPFENMKIMESTKYGANIAAPKLMDSMIFMFPKGYPWDSESCQKYRVFHGFSNDFHEKLHFWDRPDVRNTKYSLSFSMISMKSCIPGSGLMLEIPSIPCRFQ